MASVCQLRPDSRGFVRIKSKDPAMPPAIQPRYLSARGDCDTIVAGLKKLREVMDRPVVRKLIAEERTPGEKVVSDADLLGYARATGAAGLSSDIDLPGMEPDANAVVDERLRVRASLACASSTPPSCRPWCLATPTPAAVMIGEKGADMVLKFISGTGRGLRLMTRVLINCGLGAPRPPEQQPTPPDCRTARDCLPACRCAAAA